MSWIYLTRHLSGFFGPARARAKDIMYEKKASRDIEQLLMASQAEKAESVDDHDAELDDLYNEADAAFNRGTSSSYDIKLLAKGFQRLMLKISDIEEAVSTLQAAADTLLGPKKQCAPLLPPFPTRET